MPTPEPPSPQPTLAERLAVNPSGDGYAYRPGVVFLREREPAARHRLNELVPDAEEEEAPPDDSDEEYDGVTRRPFLTSAGVVKMTNVDDAVAVVEQLVAEGFDAQPEHVLFAHGSDCGGGCGPHPADIHHLAGQWATPFRATPFRATPFRATLLASSGPPTSSVVPAFGRELPERVLNGPGRAPRVVVLDTGLAGDVDGVDTCPQLLARPAGRAGEWRIKGDADVADARIDKRGGGHYEPDGYLDPVAGHGTFIAGLIEQLAPGCPIRLDRVVRPLGDVDEGDVAKALEGLIALPDGARPDIISMSFGGHLAPGAFALRQLIATAHRKGIVLVASAGNDGSCIPNYPAAFDNVVAVGAVGPDGPAPWTNYGPWVDACAPGVDLVSSFFAAFEGKLPMINGVDPDNFVEWARWSGTSFATPVVVAALAREMVTTNCTASIAVDRVVHAPHLLRIPCLGTVVNI